MSTDLTIRTSGADLAAQMDYAKAVASGDLLPQAYRDKPANVLIAVGLGAAMGLSFAESLYRIDVIQGTPTASAELIASNVRKAGHKLRVRVDERAQSATATIIRADDPGYEHTVIRDMAWAKQMGLAAKSNYKTQPTTMLQWRAISAVARMACPEALYGVAYTADEIFDTRAEHSEPADRPRSGGTRLAQAVQAQATPDTDHPDSSPALAEDIHDAEIEEDAEPITQVQTRKLFALLREIGIDDRDSGLAYMSETLGREVESSKTLTKTEASLVIDALDSLTPPEGALNGGEQS